MAEDTIVVNIISNIDEVMLRLDTLGTAAERTTGGRRLDVTLPGINREMRIILGQVPGMRQAMMYYFRLRRMERAMAKIPDVGYVSFYLTLIATAIIVAQEIMRYFKNIKRERERYETFVMRERDWTRKEYEAEQSRTHNYMRSIPG